MIQVAGITLFMVKSVVDPTHILYFNTRLKVLATEKAISFYNLIGFRDFYGLGKKLLL